MQLGTCADGRVLSYDEGLYEFSLAGKPASIAEVRALDALAKIHWRAAEMRDWLGKIDESSLAACHKRALAERNTVEYDKLTAEERVLADAERDDSVLAGKIVEADPALVHAVANSLIEQGLLAEGVPRPQDSHAGASGADGQEDDAFNALAVMDLPRGMESLSQLERAKGPRRKMTRAEERLMRKILKNDDKAKAKRERHDTAQPEEKSQPEEETE